MISAYMYISRCLGQSVRPDDWHSMPSTMSRRMMGPVKRLACAMVYNTAVPANVGPEPTRQARASEGLSGFFSSSAAQSLSNCLAKVALSISGRWHRSSGSRRRRCPVEIRGETCEKNSCCRKLGLTHFTGPTYLSATTEGGDAAAATKVEEAALLPSTATTTCEAATAVPLPFASSEVAAVGAIRAESRRCKHAPALAVRTRVTRRPGGYPLVEFVQVVPCGLAVPRTDTRGHDDVRR
mmetsp:Transcript_2923/g.7071  ORF Transcript_2923/g.7071 Transcript_2923/m.7071 type:complete len:239 (+) Transcript_2923:1748-2464(+)